MHSVVFVTYLYCQITFLIYLCLLNRHNLLIKVSTSNLGNNENKKVWQLKYIVLTLIYLYVVFMAWSGFGWLGVAYVILVPIPLVFFSWLLRRSRKRNAAHPNAPVSLWTSPIPYLSVIFLAFIMFNFIGK